MIENLNDIGKKQVKCVQAAIEPDLVYPLLRGRDVSRWRAQPSAYIVVAQQPGKASVGFDESQLKVKYPHTHAYLKEFEDVLRQRADYRKYFNPQKDPFYSMYNVGSYTFAPYKVVWRYIAGDFISAVPVGEVRTAIPDSKLVLVPCTSMSEAHYVCATLNSLPARLTVRSYTVGTQISTHVLEHVAIPRFNPAKSLHRSLSARSQRAHQLAALGKEAQAELARVEEEIDRLAAELWGITQVELEEIGRALAELD